MSNETKQIIVDANDKEIGLKSRGEMTREDFYRVSALWLTNTKGEILLAQRAHTKINHPGLWGPAVAGTLDEGETYLSNIIKETEEEIGLVLSEKDFILGPKTDTFGSAHQYFTQWFFAEIEENTKLVFDPLEVETIKWFSYDLLKKDLEINPEKYLKSMKGYFELLTNTP